MSILNIYTHIYSYILQYMDGKYWTNIVKPCGVLRHVLFCLYEYRGFYGVMWVLYGLISDQDGLYIFASPPSKFVIRCCVPQNLIRKKVLMNLWCESWKQTKAWMPITLEQKVVVMVEQSQCKWHVKPQWHLITRQLRLHHNHIAQLHEWNAIWHSVGVSPGYSLNIIGSSKYHNLQHSWYKIGGICIKKYTLWEIVFASDCLSKPIRWLEQFMSAA